MSVISGRVEIERTRGVDNNSVRTMCPSPAEVDSFHERCDVDVRLLRHSTASCRACAFYTTRYASTGSPRAWKRNEWEKNKST
eukprot:scaffold1307_cov151-Amphora_coffeaeformis.AAC.9